MASNSVESRIRDKKDSEGFIARRIRFFFDVLFWIATALFISILIEWLGIFLSWWPQPGELHSSVVLQKELSWINKDFSSVLGSPAESSFRFSRYMYETFFVWFGFDLIQSLINVDSLAGVSAYIKASINVIQLFFSRLVILIFSLPVFLIFAIVVIVDGAVVRDIRKFGLDLERLWIWSNAKVSIKPLVVVPFITYLDSPWSIHPDWIILPFVLMLSTALWLVTSKFKKNA